MIVLVAIIHHCKSISCYSPKSKIADVSSCLHARQSILGAMPVIMFICPSSCLHARQSILPAASSCIKVLPSKSNRVELKQPSFNQINPSLSKLFVNLTSSPTFYLSPAMPFTLSPIYNTGKWKLCEILPSFLPPSCPCPSSSPTRPPRCRPSLPTLLTENTGNCQHTLPTLLAPPQRSHCAPYHLRASNNDVRIELRRKLLEECFR
jgi:hypothetical protein